MSRSALSDIKRKAKPRVLNADKAQIASILNGLKNDSSYKQGHREGGQAGQLALGPHL